MSKKGVQLLRPIELIVVDQSVHSTDDCFVLQIEIREKIVDCGTKASSSNGLRK